MTSPDSLKCRHPFFKKTYQPPQSHVCPRCRCRGTIALSPRRNQQVQVVYGLLFVDPVIQAIERLMMCREKKMLWLQRFTQQHTWKHERCGIQPRALWEAACFSHPSWFSLLPLPPSMLSHVYSITALRGKQGFPQTTGKGHNSFSQCPGWDAFFPKPPVS